MRPGLRSSRCKAGATPKTTATPIDSENAKSSTCQSIASGTTIDVGKGGSISMAMSINARARPIPSRPLTRNSTIVSVSS